MITAPRRTPPKGRSGPRSRRVPPPRRSFLERNRSRLLWAGVAAVVAVGGVLVYFSFTQKAYACLSEWTPPAASASAAPAASPGASAAASPIIGYFQDDLGRGHVDVGTKVKYTFCPPASGQHYNAAGAGPITPKLYGPNDVTVPMNWVHNMEHGAMVILYRCGSGDTCDANQQAGFQSFFNAFPNSPVCNVPKGVIGPVITRFDDMAFPYAALVWDWVLPMTTWDPNAALAFFNQHAERTNPEQVYCSGPSASPGPSSSSAPTDSTPPAESPAPAGS